MINVIKASGEIEPFSEEKLRASIKRAGINSKTENRAIEQIKRILYDKIPSSLIYNQVKQYLGESTKDYGSKYSLKQAIMEFGPTGYPFEDFIAEVLKNQGYGVQTRVELMGKCINHEIDVLAKKDNEKIMVEAKFHNLPGTKTDVHVSLYTKARFDDLKEKNGLTKAILITNTKMTVDAISYADCVGLNLISWNYPNEENLRDLIEKQNLHPVTQLDSITTAQKKILLENHIVVCKDITDKNLAILSLEPQKLEEVISEANYICGHL